MPPPKLRAWYERADLRGYLSSWFGTGTDKSASQ